MIHYTILKSEQHSTPKYLIPPPKIYVIILNNISSYLMLLLIYLNINNYNNNKIYIYIPNYYRIQESIIHGYIIIYIHLILINQIYKCNSLTISNGIIHNPVSNKLKSDSIYKNISKNIIISWKYPNSLILILSD